MSRELVFGASLFERLRSHLLQRAPAEEAAVLLAGSSQEDGVVRLYVREFHPVPTTGFATRGSAFLQVDPRWYAPLLKRCRDEGWSFVLAHSHPFGSDAHFSGIDDGGEQDLMPRLFQRAPGRPHGALVLGMRYGSARIWLPSETRGTPCERIAVRGERISNATATGPRSPTVEPRSVRQIEALGTDGQRRLAQASVGLVGLGGLGSHVYLQLKYLGVRRVVLVDDDIVEESNLNRLVYATAADVGRPKVDVAHARGREILASSADIAVNADVTTSAGLRTLINCDVVVSATDNLSSRVAINRLLTQHLLPIIDTGVAITTEAGRVRAIVGRVTRLQPDGPCLSCLGILDPIAVANEADRSATYVSGEVVTAPSVVTLNGVVASLAASELLEALTGYLPKAPDLPRSLLYDGTRGWVKVITESPQPCGTCALVYARGDLEPLPVRR